MTVNFRLGESLSRELTPVNRPALELLPLAEVCDRLAHRLDALVERGAQLSVRKLKAKMAAAEGVEGELRAALQSREFEAFVYHRDGRLFGIPANYWGSFHDFRPLAGEGFCADGEHGQLAFELNGQGVFLDKHQANAKWPQEGDLPGNESMRAMAMEVPATLEGIGAVIKTDEALNRIAYGKPSNDDIYQWNDQGEGILLHADGTPATRESSEAKLAQFRRAMERAIELLRDGDLTAYVAERSTSRAIVVPALYWNSVAGFEGLFLYRGFARQDNLRGLPILVAKADVERHELGTHVDNAHPSSDWTDKTMKEWWESEGFTDGKAARNAFMKQPNTRGMSASFESAWKRSHAGRLPGRPSKLK
jgi:hypothetical protein